MKIKDHLFTDAVITKHLEPNISKIPTNHFPLLLSTLWITSRHMTKTFFKAALELTHREK